MSKKKARRSLMDLEPSPTEPDPVVQAIAAPEAGAHLRRVGPRRNRRWDKKHRAYTYKVPHALHDRARKVRESLLGLAQQYQTTVDDVATALVRAALAALRDGEIEMEYRPAPQGKVMTVEVVREIRENGWPQRIPKPKPRKKAPKPVWLAFRWPREVADEIARAAIGTSKAAVVVLLLEVALERVQAGKWHLKPRPVHLRQTVAIVRSRKTPLKGGRW